MFTDADLEKMMGDAKEPLSKGGRGTLVTAAAIKKLMADAKEPLIRERVKIELAGLKEELAVAKEERRAKKETLSEDYTDTGVVSFNNELTKSIKDLLLPGYKAIFESTKESVSAHGVNIETYKSMQLIIMRRIAALEAEVRELIQKSADFSGNPQMNIDDDITSKGYELVDLREFLDKVSEEIAKEVLAKAEAEAKRMSLGLAAARFKDKIPAPGKPISSKRTVIEAEVLTLYSKIEKLEKRKEVLETDPDKLGAEILSLMEEGKEVPSDKIRTLKLLAMGSSIEMFEEEPMREEIKVPMKETAAYLAPLQSLNDTKLLASSKSSEYTKSEIIRMAAAVAYYIRVLNEAKLLKERVETLKGNETNLTKTAEYRRNIFDIDKTIEEIEKAIKKHTDFLNNQIFYFNGLLSDQTSLYYKAGDLAVRMSQAELHSTAAAKDDSIMGALKDIAAKIPILDNCYPAPFMEGLNEDAPRDEASMLTDLKGEQYPTEHEKDGETQEAEKTISEAPEGTDLSKLDPNSETSISMVPEAKKEPVMGVSLDLLSPMSDQSGNLEESSSDQVVATKEPDNKPIEQVPIAQAIKTTPMLDIKEKLSAAQSLPVSTPENPIYPASVNEYKQRVETRGIEPKKELPISPAPRVVKTDKVNVPKMPDLIIRACEALRKFFEQVEGMRRI